ncbi:restriction endonuclease [Virgibacillus salexigens]|uniref:restriction endonuclease n=1 Tax=Virgibacillus massiliensis TaxID=1462526 RepID=UPI00136A0F63|nr:restriction endonuclease [Virgibacillus massiliensis]MYL43996.1 restriction endonuclease [Virgibacillus massiliensis]
MKFIKVIKVIILVYIAFVIYGLFPINDDRLLLGILVSIFILPYFLKLIIRLIRERAILKKLSKAGIQDIDKMDGFQFEVYLKALLKALGYKSTVTSGSHDFGADLIMKKEGKKIAIQAKRYGYRNRVGIEAIQQVYASKPFYKVDECWVMTNSLFTKSARQLAKACDVKLYDRYKLSEFINKVNPEVTAKYVVETVEPEKRKCPVCSGELMQRTSKTGNRFMGCSNYPNCTHTEKVAK